MSSSKNLEIAKTSFLSKSNSAFIEEMYLRYIENDNSLPSSWKDYFETLGEELDTIVKEIEGPTWKPQKKKINVQISEEKKLPRMMSIQNVYSLVNRVFDIAKSEVSMREKCGLLAYSPLAGGRLSGKYANGNMPKNSRYTLWPKRFSRHHTKRGEIAIDKYVKLAEKFGILPSTFANTFVLNRPFVTSSIIGATSVSHLKENIDSINIKFTEDMFNEIEEIHKSDPNPCL